MAYIATKLFANKSAFITANGHTHLAAVQSTQFAALLDSIIATYRLPDCAAVCATQCDSLFSAEWSAVQFSHIRSQRSAVASTKCPADFCSVFSALVSAFMSALGPAHMFTFKTAFHGAHVSTNNCTIASAH
jgi:hypothetical protein